MNKEKFNLPTTIQIVLSQQGNEQNLEIKKTEVLIGRPDEKTIPDIDLSADTTVSRQHARIWIEEGVFWIEDLGSKFGTKVNGEEISRRGKVRLPINAPVQVGANILTVQASNRALKSFIPLPADTPGKASPDVKIGASIEAIDSVAGVALGDAATIKRQTMLLNLLAEMGNESDLHQLLQTVIQRIVDLIPGAERGTLLLCDRNRDALLLAAFVSADEPAVSETLARRAIRYRHGFIWRRGVEAELALSINRHQIQSGMYAPLFWRDKALGAICVDNPFRDTAFTEDDLRVLLAAAHYASLLVANNQLRGDLQDKTTVLERLLTNFSPRLRDNLLEKARQGRLRPGGGKSEITILFSDIRGFTNLCAGMDSQDVVDLLNDYLPPLTDAVFKFGGIVDKFVGDAVLAIFGSPEADPLQHENAVRAALAMQEAMQTVNQQRAAKGEVTCEIGIGIHSGEAFHGFIGAKDRLEFTVIGDAVNRASRYCNGASGGEVLISQEMYRRVFKSVHTEKKSITTKHEGDLEAYRVKSIRAAEPS